MDRGVGRNAVVPIELRRIIFDGIGKQFFADVREPISCGLANRPGGPFNRCGFADRLPE